MSTKEYIVKNKNVAKRADDFMRIFQEISRRTQALKGCTFEETKNKISLEVPLFFTPDEFYSSNKPKSKLEEENLIVVTFTIQTTANMDSKKILELVEEYMVNDEKEFSLEPTTNISTKEQERRLQRRQLTHKAFFLAEMMADNFDPSKLHAKDELEYYDEFKDLNEKEKEETLNNLKKAAYEFKL